MKKILLAVLMLAVVAGFGFAQDLSVGGQFTYDYIMHFEGASSSLGDMTSSVKLPLIGGSVFFDAAYAQINVGYLASIEGSYEVSAPGYSDSGDVEVSNDYFTMGLLGKYPIDLDGITIFPLVGIEYFLNLNSKDKDGNDLKKDMDSKEKDDLNMLYTRLGFGADFDLSESLFIRASVLGGYKFKSDADRDSIKDAEDMGFNDVYINTFDVQANLGIGFKL